jgi:ABC transport system ATP-binding/permease protein
MSAVQVSFEAVTKAYGTRTLLDAVSLGVSQGDRIGVVGRNGSGKSTLLRLLAGSSEGGSNEGGSDGPDAGRVVAAGSLRVGLLSQADALEPGRTVRQMIVGDVPDHTWAADPRQRSVVTGLGLADRLDDVVTAMSGGERRRVALASLLVGDCDLLILDEPTNHLDVEGVAWLASHLAGRRGSLVVATHDRWFLDEVATRVWEVTDGRVEAYDGGYSAYVLARAERARRGQVTEARRQNLLRKELAWLRRGPPARTSKPRFRIDAANALIADEPPPRDVLALRTFATSRLGKDVFDAEEVSLTLGGRTLLRDVTWRLGPGDRVALVGVNGSGKTTLLRLLTGDLRPDAGRVRRGKSVSAAFLTQDVMELDPDLRALAAVEEVGRVLEVAGGREMTASALLEQFGLPASRQWTRVGDLSGGERRRLALLRLLMGRPNVLILDEPTNDLDVDTLTALEDVLDGWPGTLVVVSHDRYFLERTCDTVMALLGDASLAMLPGGVEEYLARRRAAAPGEAVRPRTGAGPAAGPGDGGAGRSAGEVRLARKELTRLERVIDRLSRRELELHGALAGAATEHQRLVELDAELRAVVAEKGRAEDAWLTLATALEDG